MANITFSDKALERMTIKQRDSLVDLVRRYKADEAEIHIAFDLPSDYIAVTIPIQGATLSTPKPFRLYCGIDGEGAISN